MKNLFILCTLIVCTASFAFASSAEEKRLNLEKQTTYFKKLIQQNYARYSGIQGQEYKDKPGYKLVEAYERLATLKEYMKANSLYMAPFVDIRSAIENALVQFFENTVQGKVFVYVPLGDWEKENAHKIIGWIKEDFGQQRIRVLQIQFQLGLPDEIRANTNKVFDKMFADIAALHLDLMLANYQVQRATLFDDKP